MGFRGSGLVVYLFLRFEFGCHATLNPRGADLGTVSGGLRRDYRGCVVFVVSWCFGWDFVLFGFGRFSAGVS